MSIKNERIEKSIVRELSIILLKDAKNSLLKFVSITKANMTADMAQATIWFTVLGEEDEVEATKKALEDAKGYLRSELAKRLDLRKTPELKFKYDGSLAYGNKIEKILEDINK